MPHYRGARKPYAALNPDPMLQNGSHAKCIYRAFNIGSTERTWF